MLDEIAKFASIASAAVAVIAALAALRSARAAELTARNAALATKRSLLREIVSSAQSILDDALACETLGEQLNAQHVALCGITGNPSDGSERNLFAAKTAERLAPIAPMTEHAQGLADAYSRLFPASADDLSKMQAQLAGDLMKLRNLRADLRSELVDLSAKCQAENQRRYEERKRVESLGFPPGVV